MSPVRDELDDALGHKIAGRRLPPKMNVPRAVGLRIALETQVLAEMWSTCSAAACIRGCAFEHVEERLGATVMPVRSAMRAASRRCSRAYVAPLLLKLRVIGERSSWRSWAGLFKTAIAMRA